MFFPIKYSEPVFRPPSEAGSLILQITHGCTWNKCAFCEMYTSKKFSIKDLEEIQKEIESLTFLRNRISKIFLADGDAFALSTEKLLNILHLIKTKLPAVRRISCYAKPKDALNKSREELAELKKEGLDLVYVGVESGNDNVLELVRKGETYENMKNGLLKLKESGIKQSVMIINGLGGKKMSEIHALDSARLMNDIQPEFLSTLVLSFPFGREHFQRKISENFQELSVIELLMEIKLFLETCNLQQTVFRSDHASNYLILKGILSKDKISLLRKIENAIKLPNSSGLREEFERGL